MTPSWSTRLGQGTGPHGWTKKLILGQDTDVRLRHVNEGNDGGRVVYRGQVVRVNVPRYAYCTFDCLTDRLGLNDVYTLDTSNDIVDDYYRTRPKLMMRSAKATVNCVRPLKRRESNLSSASITRYHSDPNILDIGQPDASR